MDGRDLYHVVANGKTTGFASIFFKVDDTYQTYFTPKDIAPIKFKREVYEGGYTMDLEVDFDHKKQTAVLWDKKKDTLYNFKTQKGIQDIVSAFYYLRNKVSLSDLKVGDFTVISMLFDDDGVFPFKLEYLGKEVLNTKFGKVSCLKFRPYVQSGRVFEGFRWKAPWQVTSSPWPGLRKLPLQTPSLIRLSKSRLPRNRSIRQRWQCDLPSMTARWRGAKAPR